MPENKWIQGADALNLLGTGSIEVIGRMPYSSNATLLVKIQGEGDEIAAIYKPHQGERPLWDFPDGLYQREVAAYRLSESLGWDLIPPTIIRYDAPYGVGSLQLFIDARFDEHYFTLMDRPELASTFIRFCVFDLIANNTDRKSGHILIDKDDHLWGIDNGLTFHEDSKLRTVIWEFGGTQIPEQDRELLRKNSSEISESLSELISEVELEALTRRIKYVISKKKLPKLDPEYRPYPWPLV